jgi:hypothetical protein
VCIDQATPPAESDADSDADADADADSDSDSGSDAHPGNDDEENLQDVNAVLPEDAESDARASKDAEEEFQHGWFHTSFARRSAYSAFQSEMARWWNVAWTRKSNESLSHLQHSKPPGEFGNRVSLERIMVECTRCRELSSRLYCLCRRRDFGEMIRCDNVECVAEWFHFCCVDITTKPADAWYCSQACTQSASA